MQKIFLFSVGIGGNTNERELRGIATDPDNFMFKVDGYSALDGIKNLLAVRTCRGRYISVRLAPVLQTIFHQCVISYSCSQSNSNGFVLKQSH